jgi:hypothetical protein
MIFSKTNIGDKILKKIPILVALTKKPSKYGRKKTTFLNAKKIQLTISYENHLIITKGIIG